MKGLFFRKNFSLLPGVITTLIVVTLSLIIYILFGFPLDAFLIFVLIILVGAPFYLILPILLINGILTVIMYKKVSSKQKLFIYLGNVLLSIFLVSICLVGLAAAFANIDTNPLWPLIKAKKL